MKNKEKYNDFLLECSTDDNISFGVDKLTGEPKVCCSIYSEKNQIRCSGCKFGSRLCAPKRRKEWLEEEADEWSDFRNLKNGDIIMFNVGAFWYPVIFVKLDEFGLCYTVGMNANDNAVCAIEHESDPRRVRKL